MLPIFGVGLFYFKGILTMKYKKEFEERFSTTKNFNKAQLTLTEDGKKYAYPMIYELYELYAGLKEIEKVLLEEF